MSSEIMLYSKTHVQPFGNDDTNILRDTFNIFAAPSKSTMTQQQSTNRFFGTQTFKNRISTDIVSNRCLQSQNSNLLNNSQLEEHLLNTSTNQPNNMFGMGLKQQSPKLQPNLLQTIGFSTPRMMMNDDFALVDENVPFFATPKQSTLPNITQTKTWKPNFPRLWQHD